MMIMMMTWSFCFVYSNVTQNISFYFSIIFKELSKGDIFIASINVIVLCKNVIYNCINMYSTNVITSRRKLTSKWLLTGSQFELNVHNKNAYFIQLCVHVFFARLDWGVFELENWTSPPESNVLHKCVKEWIIK